MRMISGSDDAYVLSCVKTERALIAEGLYAVDDTGWRYLEAKVPNEVDTAMLHDEPHLLRGVHAQINAAIELEETPCQGACLNGDFV